jgi:hypothetical protein
MYVDRPDFARMLNAPPLRDCYMGLNRTNTFPVLQSSESLADMIKDCERYLMGELDHPRTMWMAQVFLPAMRVFQSRKPSQDIAAEDWRLACNEWVLRKQANAKLKG